MKISKYEQEARKLEVNMAAGMNRFGGHMKMTETEISIINEYTEGSITHEEMENKLIENVLQM